MGTMNPEKVQRAKDATERLIKAVKNIPVQFRMLGTINALKDLECHDTSDINIIKAHAPRLADAILNTSTDYVTAEALAAANELSAAVNAL